MPMLKLLLNGLTVSFNALQSSINMSKNIIETKDIYVNIMETFLFYDAKA
jgi:hypothetical protein